MSVEELAASIISASDAAGDNGHAFVAVIEALIEKSGLPAEQIAAARWEASQRIASTQFAAAPPRPWRH